jgi:hypothetical protein
MPRGVSPVDEARLQRRLWTPTASDMGNGLLLHSDVGVQLTASNKATQWTSLFGGWTFTQSDDGLRPVLTRWPLDQVALLNSGLGASSTRLTGTTLFTPFEAASNFSIFVVFNATGTGWFLSKGSATPSERVGVVVIGSDLYMVLNGSVVIAPVPLNTNCLATIIYSSGAVTMRLNGQRVSTGTLPIVTGANANNRLVIGPSTDPNVMPGLLRDVMVLPYSASLPLIEKVEGYLHWRGNRSTGFASSHPFRNRPPLIGD